MSKEKNRVPELISDELYETAIPFIDFLKKYYEFTKKDEFSPSAVINRDQILRNVQNTTSTFLRKIYQEVGASAYLNKENTDDDVANLLQNLRILYEAKGSLESIKVLFRIVFGEEVSIYLPKEFILKPSDGDWQTEYSFIAELVSGDPLDIVGEFVQIETQFPGATAQRFNVEVVRVDTITAPNQYRIYVTKEAVNVFYYDSVLTFGDVEMVIKPIMDSLVLVAEEGSGFSFAKSYPVKNYARNYSQFYWQYPDVNDFPFPVVKTRLNRYYTEQTGTRRYFDIDDPSSQFATESYVISATTDGLKQEIITRANEQITKLYYDGKRIEIRDKGDGKLEKKIINDATVRAAPDINVDWDNVIYELAKVANGVSDGALYSYFTTNPGYTLTADSAPAYTVRVLAGTIDSAVGDSGSSTLILDSASNISIGDLIYGDSSLAFGTTITQINNTEIRLSTPLLAIMPATDSDVALTVQDNILDSSTTLYLDSSSTLSVGDLITGVGLDSETHVLSILDSSRVLLSKPHNGVASGTTLSVNNYQRGDIDHDGNISLDDIDLFVRRFLSHDISDTSYYWIRNIIEGTLDSSQTPDSFTLVTNQRSSAGSTVLNVDNSTGLVVGMTVSGSGIDSDSEIVSIDSDGAVSLSLPLDSDVTGDVSPVSLTFGTEIGENARIRPTNLGDSDKITDFRFQNFGVGYPTNFLGIVSPDSGQDYVGLFRSNPVTLTSGNYVGVKGHLSNVIKLQDGNFYQDFSYVIRSDTQITEFEDILYRTTHPAGMKVFGELVAGQNISLNIGLSVSEVSQLDKILQDDFTSVDSCSKLLTRDLLGDSASVTEGTLVLSNNKVFADYVIFNPYYVADGYTDSDWVFDPVESIQIRLNGTLVADLSI